MTDRSRAAAPVPGSSSGAERRPRRLLRGLAAALGLAAAGLAAAYVWAVAERAHLAAPAPTPLLLDRDGVFLAQLPTPGEGRADYGFWIVDPLPQRVIAATLALEDRRFWQHPGVDPAAVARAFWQNLSSGRRTSGASTIAMQVARMQQPAARGLVAKALEAGTAVALTWRYGREAVLAHYLRLVPYANSSHGIGHAARWYLDKPVQDLSWAEIALLSAIPQAPARMNPLTVEGRARAVQRGRRSLALLAERGVMSGEEHALAQQQIGRLVPPLRGQRPAALHAILQLAQRGLPTGSNPRIETTLDLGLQTAVERQLQRHLAEWRPAGAQQAAVLVVRRQSREVLAMAGSADYFDPQGGAIDFSRVARSPGSTLKPFVFALALQDGTLRPDEILGDLPEGASSIGNSDGRFLGPMLPRQALANSRNVPATNLLRAVGIERAYDFLRSLGLHDQPDPAGTYGLAMAIGALPTTLEKLVRAYGALGDDGRLRDLVWYRGQPRGEAEAVLSPTVARQLTLFLSDAQARLPSFARGGSTDFPFPVALKTGTSQGYRDAWTVAFSSDYIVGVWVGRIDAGTMTQLSGARSAARLAQALLLRLHRVRAGDLQAGSFPPPDGFEPVELCAYTGKRATGSCSPTLIEWLPAAAIPLLEADGPPLLAGAIAVAAPYRAWAKANRFAAETPIPSPEAPVAISILSPEHNAHLWRNPEAPAAAGMLALKAQVSAPGQQIVWYVDGEPFGIADADQPLRWPLRPGTHSFQVKLPFRDEASRVVRIVVE
jgi:penicillin-binding protein 1C